MAHVDPTASEIKSRFTEFASVADSVIDAAILEAKLHVDESWPEVAYKIAIMYRACHQLVLDGVGTSGQIATLNSMGITSFGIDDASVSRSQEVVNAQLGSQGDEASSTKYGKRFVELRKKYFGGGIWV